MRGSQKSIILVARQLGVHIGPNDIPERFQIDDRELRASEMCDLAQSFDLKAKATKISEKELLKLLSKKQQILRLKNGRYIIALRVIQGEEDDDKSVLCLDTGVTSPKPQQINLKELKKGWDGEVILLKAKLKKFEEDSELKIGWLIGESFRNKSVMVQVVIVALILNIFAVIPAVFMMLVLDKVVNYEAYSTLYVITSGVVVAYVFNGIPGTKALAIDREPHFCLAPCFWPVEEKMLQYSRNSIFMLDVSMWNLMYKTYMRTAPYKYFKSSFYELHGP